MILSGFFSQILIFQVFVFLIGLAVGSFVNCFSWRLENKRARTEVRYYNLLFSRSFCDQCKRQLAWWENVPVVSWLILGGRCRSCHSAIPYQYPVVEFLTGMIFVGVFREFGELGDFWGLFFWWFFTVALMIVFTSDWLYGIIPDIIVFPASLLAIFFIVFFHLGGVLIQHLLSASGAALFFYAIVYLTRGKGMGMGDVKLAFLMGLLLGWPKILVAIWLAFVIGALGAGVLLILQKKKFSDTMVLGPFLVMGTFLSFFFGEQLWKIFLPI